MGDVDELDFESDTTCPNCGHHIDDETECPNCGAILGNDDELEGFQDEEEM